MKTFLDIQISMYQNLKDAVGTRTTLRHFLFSEEHRTEIERLRSEEDPDERKRLKSALPMATISGLFSHRDKQHLIAHSGLICIDIDGKDNPDMDVQQTKRKLAEFDEMAYIGLSVGGRGLFCIMPIAQPEKHEEHFLALKDDFREWGIVIDDQCKDITRARIMSYDSDPHVNEDAIAYTYTKKKPKPPVRRYRHDDSDKTIRKVYDLCSEIQSLGLDITNGYNDWLEVGSSLANLGEDGRDAFHIVSSVWVKYDPAETDKKFNNLLRTIREYTIGTFFYICKDYGIGV